jgi:hypothetical protein
MTKTLLRGRVLDFLREPQGPGDTTPCATSRTARS